jgi:hypothetical protein
MSESKLASRFRNKGAVSLADAMPFVPTSTSEKRAFERLKGGDVLRTDGQDRWYLDESRWETHRAGRRNRAVLAMLTVGAAAAFAALR